MGWLKDKTKMILEIKGTPKSVAIGVAVGMFFGFTPLFGLKTLLAVSVTWILRGNKVSSAITVTLHDVILPLLPVLLRLEYDLGYWLLSNPHELPPHLSMHHLEAGAWLDWSTFLTAGRPILIGSAVIGAPISIVVYFLVNWILTKKELFNVINKPKKILQ